MNRSLKISFIILSIVFLMGSIYLASVNNSPGLPDARNNLDTARNIISSKGFTTNMIQQLFVELELPGPESHRPPGIPYLLAITFSLFGISMAIPILLNAIAVLASAWLIRSALKLANAGWYADLAGILMLLSDNFVLDSILNNNFIVLCVCALIYFIALNETRDIKPIVLASIFAIIGAIGFFFKPTFIITAFLVAIYLLLVQKRSSNPRNARLTSVAVFIVLFVAITSPYWIFNLINFGKPVYSPLTTFRLVERYGGFEQDTWWYYRIGNPPTYNELIDINGAGGLIKKEIQIWIRAAIAVIKLNPLILLLALMGIFLNRSNLRSSFPIPVLLILVEPLFSSFIYWRGEDRYVWPMYPAVIYLVGLIIRDFLISKQISKISINPSIVKNAVIALLVLSVLFGAYRTMRPWKRAFEKASIETPTWVESVSLIPEDAVVLTDNPWSVSWYAEKLSVICPAGSRDDLLSVIEIYKPEYYLHTNRGYSYSPDKGQLAFIDSDLELISSGTSPRGEWKFYHLRINSETN